MGVLVDSIKAISAQLLQVWKGYAVGDHWGLDITVVTCTEKGHRSVRIPLKTVRIEKQNIFQTKKEKKVRFPFEKHLWDIR